jgi:hypothetical protein
MSEFKHQGGVLSGREERSDAFAGEPRAVGSTLGTSGGNHTLGGPGAAGSTSMTDGNATGHHHHNTTDRAAVGSGMDSTTGTTGETHHKGGLLAKLNPKVDSDGDGKAGFMK